jgi:hypothetical protein
MRALGLCAQVQRVFRRVMRLLHISSSGGGWGSAFSVAAPFPSPY